MDDLNITKEIERLAQKYRSKKENINKENEIIDKKTVNEDDFSIVKNNLFHNKPKEEAFYLLKDIGKNLRDLKALIRN